MTMMIVVGWLLIILLATIETTTTTTTPHDRKILVSRFSGAQVTDETLCLVRERLRNETIIRLYGIEPKIKQFLLQAAEKQLYQRRDYPTATEYMEYFRTGNRAHFEAKLSRFRTSLSYLAVGQLLRRETNETDRRYLDAIVDSVWSLLESRLWIHPASLHLQKSPDWLPDPGVRVIDLTLAETAKLIAWMRLLFSHQFDEITPAITAGIDSVLHRRLFDAYLYHRQYWAMGPGPVNNWNPWINSNIFRAALMTISNATRFNAIANRTFYSVDHFIDSYGDSGGCDEGPAYWRQASGRLGEYLWLLAATYPGAGDRIRSVSLIRSMGDYIYKLHIADNWFVNFADSSPRLNLPSGVIMRFGLLFNDTRLKQFASFLYHRESLNEPDESLRTLGHHDLDEFFNLLEMLEWLRETKPLSPPSPPNGYYLPDIQVFTATSGSVDNFTLGAKFGNNGESHNHNDVGNFVLFHGATPILIDIGVGQYNATTFGPHRYDILYFNSDYHNCPTINGWRQNAGPQFRAKSVHFRAEPNGEMVFHGDIAGAYPPEAHVQSWNRTIRFGERKTEKSENKTAIIMVVEDRFRLDKFLQPQQLNFIVPEAVHWQPNAAGILLNHTEDYIAVQLQFDWHRFSPNIQETWLDFGADPVLTRGWTASGVKRLTLATAADYRKTDDRFLVKIGRGDL